MRKIIAAVFLILITSYTPAETDARGVAQTTKLAQQGNLHAQLTLGLMYYEGEGVHQDYAEAKSWFEKAAQKDDVSAQALLGMMYRRRIELDCLTL